MCRPVVKFRQNRPARKSKYICKSNPTIKERNEAFPLTVNTFFKIIPVNSKLKNYQIRYMSFRQSSVFEIYTPKAVIGILKYQDPVFFIYRICV